VPSIRLVRQQRPHLDGLLAGARSTFQRHPASVRDPHAGNLDDPAVRLHGLAVSIGEAVADQARQHVDIKPVREQRCPSAAAPYGEHLKRHTELLRNFRDCAATLPRPHHAYPQILRIGLPHPILAPSPARILNPIRVRMGIPLDSIFSRNALAPFGFAASGASRRMVYARSVNAVHQRKNIFEWHWVHSTPGLKLFALLLVIVGTVGVTLFFWQLHLTRQCTRDVEEAADAAKEAADEQAAALAELNNYHLDPELLTSIKDTLNEA